MCSAVCAAHSLPYFEIDKIQWKPNWTKTPTEEFEQSHRALLNKDRWLIDGFGSMSSVEDRLNSCDTVIFVDHPILVHFWWATKRQFKSVFFGRPDGPEGCPMWRVTFKLYRMMWRLHRDVRPKLIDEIYRRSDRIRVIHIKSPKELNVFTANPI